MGIEVVRPGRGRPRKYGRESRPITVTLPADVLERLKELDTDIGQAIVGLVERQSTRNLPAPRRTELTPFGSHAVIIVKPVKALKRLPGVQLVPVGNGRALIALDRPLSIPDLELAVRDALDGTELTESEQQSLKEIAEILRQARFSRTMLVKERTIIVLESKRRSGRGPERVPLKSRVPA